MSWSQRLVEHITSPQVVNDSKTPSGPAHVGALRGVLIHDAVYRALKSAGVAVEYRFGSDDYDPLDELPAAGGEQFRRYLGMPLCEVPAPPDSMATDLADHYIGQFFQIFTELGVGAHTYRVRDLYRSGALDAQIDAILRHGGTVRRIYREVSGARKPDDWHPFQAICEKCGRIGTTMVTKYDGTNVHYRCVPDLVRWAEGCGHSGTTSPFGGGGKLVWKLEWVAKWDSFPVSIEGAGKDHNSKGGSRDVAVRCFREIFAKEPPLNIHYEFFVAGGAKMSSSRGVGVSAREMADLLPPEVLRYLMLRVPPNKVVDFAPTEEKIIRLFKDFDRERDRATSGGSDLFPMFTIGADEQYESPPFDLLLSLVQLPHIDLRERVSDLLTRPLEGSTLVRLEQRLGSARYWLAHYAADAERLELKTQLPPSCDALAAVQVAFLRRLGEDLRSTSWNAEQIQAQIFDTARLTPLPQPEAFAAIYRVLFDRKSGPRAGNLLAFLDREFVLSRLGEPRLDSEQFLYSASVPDNEAAALLADCSGGRVQHVVAVPTLLVDGAGPLGSGSVGSGHLSGHSLVEFYVVKEAGKIHARRVRYGEFEGMATSLGLEQEEFLSHVGPWLETISTELGTSFEVADVRTDSLASWAANGSRVPASACAGTGPVPPPETFA